MVQETLVALQAQLAELTQQSKAEVCVLWQEIDGDAPLFSYNAGQQMVSASLIKVPILLLALQQVRQGNLSLDTLIEVPQAEILEDSTVFDTGPRSASLEELLTWMTVVSDNTATNVLIEHLGMDAVNRLCRALGLTHTNLQRKMLDLAAIAAGRNNYTSGADMFLLFRALCNGSALPPSLSEKALHILRRQRLKGCLPRYIWEDVNLAHKTGGMDHLSHDTGVFTLGGRQYYLGVLVQNAPSIQGEPALIGRISRLIFDYSRAV